MNANQWFNSKPKQWTRRLAVPVLALALIGSFVT